MSAIQTTPRRPAEPVWPAAAARTSTRPDVRVRSATVALVLGAILVFGLASRLVVVFTMPPWQSPDEPKHFEYIRVLTDLGPTLWAERRLPRMGDALPKLQRVIIVSMAENHYWEGIRRPPPKPLPTRFSNVWPGGTHTQLHRPSLYYFVAAPLLLPFTSASLDVQLLVVRLFSVLLSTLTIWVVYLTARIAVRDDPFVPLAAAAFVAALPMHIYIGASINNDNLEVLLGAVVCCGLVWGLYRGFTLKLWLLVLGAFLLGLITKRGMVALAPVIGLVWLFWLPSLRGWRLGVSLGMLSAMVLLGLIVIDALGPHLGPGLLLPERLRVSLSGYALNEPDQLMRLLGIGLDTPDVYQLILGHQELLFRGFWGVFGWFSLHLSTTLYTWLAVATGLCTLGFAVWLGRQALALRGTSASLARRHLLVGLTCLAAIVVMVVLAEGERLAYLTAAQIPQGRYLFVVIGPIALTLALGARTLLPARPLGTWLPLAIVGLWLLALDVHVYVSYLVPFFRTGIPN
jgi:Predicted membrane protein (DUF2142)